MIVVHLILIVMVLTTAAKMDAPVVTISEGKVRGCLGTDLEGVPFVSFLGIPYAKPPVGKLRFKAPQPIEPWDDVKDCTKVGKWCPQEDAMVTKTIGGSEDCLHLNVFTRTLSQGDSRLKPVMVWIHGGGYLMGSNDTNLYGPEYIITKDVVLVAINYRVGFFGFMTLEDSSLEVPGNAGLKDQVLALKWVQKNIKVFNGDPNNVTIFGESAGSASVHYLILSPSANGLFHKAILQSGAVLNPWTGSSLDILEFMDFIGRKVEDEKAALEILLEIPADELLLLQNEYLSTKPPFQVVGPTVEKPNSSAFLTKTPIEIMSSGEYNQVPIMIGYTSNEGLVMMCDIFKKKGTEQLEKGPTLENFIPPEMEVEKGSPTSKLICQKLADFYFQEENAKNPFMLASDYFIVIGVIASAKIHAKTSHHPVYLYTMTVETDLNLWKKLYKLDDFPGVCHCDDLGYLFKASDGPETLGEVETVCLQQFLKLWTNFAKYGNPTPDGNDLNIQWKPVDGENVNFLDIGKELTMGTNPEEERINLWRDIYQLSPATAKYL